MYGSTYDQFGLAISLSADGNTKALAIGAHGAYWVDNQNEMPGDVNMYWWDEATANYIQIGQSITGEAGGDLGLFVALSRDGKALVAGAPGSGFDSGQVKTFNVE